METAEQIRKRAEAWELPISTLMLIEEEHERAAKLARIKAELARDRLICTECYGNPEQYRADVSSVCPACDGEGSVLNPDFIDGDAGGFDPRREYGTYRVVRGRAA